MVNVGTASGCPWQIEPTAPWLTLSATAGTGPSQVRVTAAASGLPYARLASVRAGQVSLPLAQAGAPFTISSVSPATGPTTGGTQVTLTGTGFLEGATVTFGSAAARSLPCPPRR
jgi:FlaG/FlaF family flagellin (archaellin)